MFVKLKLLYCHCILSDEAWLYLKLIFFYNKKNSQPTSSRWTAHLIYLGIRCLAADYPLIYMYQSRFYHTTSHYLCHKICYHFRLVEIALGYSRNLMIYSRRFTSTVRLLLPYRTMSDYSISISSPSENKNSLIESSRPPNVRKKHSIPYS